MTKRLVFIAIIFSIYSGTLCYAEESIYICGKQIKVGEKQEEILKTMELYCSFKKDDIHKDQEEFFYYYKNGETSKIPSGYLHFIHGVLYAANKSWIIGTTIEINRLFMSLFAVLSQDNGKKAFISTDRRIYTADFSSDDIRFYFENREIQLSHNLLNGASGYQVEEYLWTFK